MAWLAHNGQISADRLGALLHNPEPQAVMWSCGRVKSTTIITDRKQDVQPQIDRRILLDCFLISSLVFESIAKPDNRLVGVGVLNDIV